MHLTPPDITTYDIVHTTCDLALTVTLGSKSCSFGSCMSWGWATAVQNDSPSHSTVITSALLLFGLGLRLEILYKGMISISVSLGISYSLLFSIN